MDTSLPILFHTPVIVSSVSSSRVVVLHAETGAGKSTCVPMMLAAVAANPRIVVSQPRRVAAARLCARVKEQLHHVNSDWRVGYRIMHDTHDPDAHIVYSTVGYLVNWLAHNSDALSRATHVVLDESHERSVDMDLLALLLKQRMRTFDFKLVIMSATLDALLYKDYFAEMNEGVEIPCISVGVKRFQVEAIFLDSLLDAPCLDGMFEEQAISRLNPGTKHPNAETNASVGNDSDEKEGWSHDPVELDADMATHVHERITQFHGSTLNPGNPGAQRMIPNIPDNDFDLAVTIALHISKIRSDESTPGECVLVFLPGESEIMTWIETLDKHLARLHPTQRARVSTHVLHSQTPREQLDRAFVPAHANMLKIVLSTNIAESSVTISDVSCVIDHGLRRALEYNSAMGCQMLKLGWISRASSTQRSGRAGRCRPGLYFGLFTKQYHDVIFRDHDLPEIQTLSLDQTVLKIKSLFPNDRVKHLLNSLIEPPSTAQLSQAFAKLVTSGALTRPPHGSTRATDFDETQSAITYLGGISSRFPCDIAHTRLLLLGAACAVAPEACVAAAALACIDPFTMPTSYFSHDRAALCMQLAASFGARALADGGAYSEPLALLRVFKEWVAIMRDAGRSAGEEWLYGRGVHQARWRQFRASIAAFAGRLGEAVRAQIPRGRGGGEGVQVVRRLEMLKAVAADGMKSRGSDNESGNMSGAELVDYMFRGDMDDIRAVILAGCSHEIYHGIPVGPVVSVDGANKRLGKLANDQASASKKSQKKTKKILEAQLAAQLFSSSGAPAAKLNTLTNAAGLKQRILDHFYKYVPTAPTVASIVARSESACTEYSYNVALFPGPISTHPPFKAHKCANLLVTGKYSPPEATNAHTLREMFGWMGCTRVLCTQYEAVLEFMEDEEAETTTKTHALASLLSQFGVLGIGSSPSATTQAPAATGLKAPAAKSVFACGPVVTEDEHVYDDAEGVRTVVRNRTTEVTHDVSMCLRFLAALGTGRKHTWMPYPDFDAAREREEGVELGKIGPAYRIQFVKAGGRAAEGFSKGFSEVAIRPNWRTPFYGSSGVRESRTEIVVEKQVRDEDGLWRLLSRNEQKEQRMDSGHAVFAAAGASQLIENPRSTFLGLTGLTLYPANDPVWNLRLLIMNPTGSALLLTSTNTAAATFHFHQSKPELDCDVEEWIRLHSFLENGYLVPEDLELLNQARYDMGRLFYDGSGLATGSLARSFIAQPRAIAQEIASRGRFDKCGAVIGVEAHWARVLERHHKEPTGLPSSIEPVAASSSARLKVVSSISGGQSEETEPEFLEYMSALTWPPWNPPLLTDDDEWDEDNEEHSDYGSDDEFEVDYFDL